MPDLKDFMTGGSTYVRGYIRGQQSVPKRKSRLPSFISVGRVLIVFIILLIIVDLPALFGLLGVGVLWFIAKHPLRKRKLG